MKQDGVFVCQSCGCKYSIEEAKKMMIEGTVEVTGTVKVDNTDKLETYKEIASNAYDAVRLILKTGRQFFTRECAKGGSPH